MEILNEPVVIVFFYALITALATGLGAIPFFFIKKISPAFLGKSNAIAAGLMLSASYNLIMQGYKENDWQTLLGMILGVVLITAGNSLLEKNQDLNLEKISAVGGKSMLLFLGVMTLHSFAEGISVGVSFAETIKFGVFISIAIAIHNIPEGLAISLVMVPKGTSALKAAGWSIFSSLPQPIMAIPAFLFVNTFRQYLPLGLGLAAGAMIWMVFAEILPESFKDNEPHVIAYWITGAVLAMSAFQILIGE